jgi:hypothetical protein
MKSKRQVGLLLLAIFLFNIADAICTWIAVPGGAAYEINPVGEWLLNQGSFAFFGVKVGVVSLALLLAYLRIESDSRIYIKVFKIVTIVMMIISILGLSAVLLMMVGA